MAKRQTTVKKPPKRIPPAKKKNTLKKAAVLKKASKGTINGVKKARTATVTKSTAPGKNAPAKNHSSAKAPDFIVLGKNANALFSLKAYRGEGMTLLAMNWPNGTPPVNFVGFAIEYQEPGGNVFYPLQNRLSFLNNDGNVNPNILSTRLSPIQKFRWVHFPRNANMAGLFVYRVTPVFMDASDKLSYGEFQEVSLRLCSETYPGELNVAFTRGFVASQAFVDKFQSHGDISTLLPGNAKDGLSFPPTHPDKDAAYEWMGFEARTAILDLLDKAIADTTAQVRVAAYDLNEPEIVSRLVQLGDRLKIIIDDSKDHGDAGSA